jgi:hypothetical protein
MIRIKQIYDTPSAVSAPPSNASGRVGSCRRKQCLIIPISLSALA